MSKNQTFTIKSNFGLKKDKSFDSDELNKEEVINDDGAYFQVFNKIKNASILNTIKNIDGEL